MKNKFIKNILIIFCIVSSLSVIGFDTMSAFGATTKNKTKTVSSVKARKVQKTKQKTAPQITQTTEITQKIVQETPKTTRQTKKKVTKKVTRKAPQKVTKQTTRKVTPKTTQKIVKKPVPKTTPEITPNTVQETSKDNIQNIQPVETVQTPPPAAAQMSIPEKNLIQLKQIGQNTPKNKFLKFIIAMFGVAISAFAIYIGLKFYKKLMNPQNVIHCDPDDYRSLETPKDFKTAINLFLNKTDI